MTQPPALGTALRGEPVQVFLAPPGTPRLPRIDRGEGIYMWDTDGRRYIDASSGPVANNLGHGNAAVLAAMQEQAGRVAFAYPGQFESAANDALAETLTALAGPGFERAFFVSGGSEAVESAVKLARQYALARGEDTRWKVITRDPGYHGGTLGALGLTGDRHQHEVFGPMTRVTPKVPAPLTYRLPDNHSPESHARACAEALDRRIVEEGADTVLAFLMEPVGGVATGALVAPDLYYAAVRQICDRHGILLIYDEVMSGAGRTGRFLAADHWPHARPDLVVLAKGIAAGYTPMGAVLAPDTIVRAVAGSGGFMNGFTYFSNPLSCAVAHAVLREMTGRDLVANAAARGAELAAGLEGLKARSRHVGDVRGLGLLMALELVADPDSRAPLPRDLEAAKLFQRLALARGLALYCRRTSHGDHGDWVMIAPPLIVTSDQVAEILAALAATLEDFDRAVTTA